MKREINRHDFDTLVLADSVNAVTGDRLTTLCVTFPRFILAEVNTHRMLSRNSASSRAIPVSKRIEAVDTHPFVPLAFGKNRAGMQAFEDLEASETNAARMTWLGARDRAVDAALVLARLGVHKQHANRLLEPFAWQTAIISATDWRNFYALRCHPDAQPEFQRIATMMREAMEASTPEALQPGQWHLPMLTEEELASVRDLETNPGTWKAHPDDAAALRHWVKVSAGRCARVSYLTHDGKRDPQADVDLADRLTTSGHMSPLEHPAVACDWDYEEGEFGHQEVRPCHGNFTGFRQYRKFIASEAVFQGGSDV